MVETDAEMQKRIENTPPERDLGKCLSCGNPAQKISSGSPECWKCWNWRKLDGPAVAHWVKVLPPVFSNIDIHDAMMWERMGLDVPAALIVLKEAMEKYQEMEKNPRPWKKEK